MGWGHLDGKALPSAPVKGQRSPYSGWMFPGVPGWVNMGKLK